MSDQLKNKFIEAFRSLKDDQLSQLRTEAMKGFEDAGFPTQKHEEWKYTSLKGVLNQDFELEQTEGSIDESLIEKFSLRTDSYRVVFVDGIWSEKFTNLSGAPFKAQSLADAIELDSDFVKKHLSSVAPLNQQAWIELNTALSKQGVVVHVAKGMQVEKPLEILYLSSGTQKAPLHQYRNLIVLDEAAELQVYERHQAVEDIHSLNNVVTEIVVGKTAHYDHYKIQNDQPNTSLIDNTWLAQEERSDATVDTFSFEGKFIRNNLSFMHKGEHIESRMYGVSLLSDNQFVDHHTLVDHAHPNCNSNQLYKGIYQGSSKGVFNGKVMVHAEAQKTNAFQQNNNVLLGDHASLDTKPQLEIFADDVKCSHGCTVGQLDDDAIFYLRSRGIPQYEAQAMLLYAFCMDALQGVRIEELQDKLKRLLAKKLGVQLDFQL